MRLDKVVEAGREKESGSSLEECCRLIGCIDLRTARMHLKRLEEAAKAIALTLAERQAAAVISMRHLPACVHSPVFERLERSSSSERKRRCYGPVTIIGTCLRVSEDLLQAELWKNRGKVLMSYVSRPPPES